MIFEGLTQNKTIKPGEIFEFGSNSYAPNRPGQTQWMSWDMYSNSGEELITGGLVSMPIQIIDTCEKNYQTKCIGKEVWSYDHCGKKESIKESCTIECVSTQGEASCNNGTLSINSVKNADNTESITIGASLSIGGTNFGSYDISKSKIWIDGNEVPKELIKVWKDGNIRIDTKKSLFFIPKGQKYHTITVQNAKGEQNRREFEVSSNGCAVKAQMVCSENSVVFANSCGDVETVAFACGTQEKCVSLGSLKTGTSTASCVYTGPKYTGTNSGSVRPEEYLTVYGNNLSQVSPTPKTIILKHTSTQNEIKLPVIQWSDSEVMVQIPSSLKKGDYTIITKGVQSQVIISILPDWCAQLLTNDSYILQLLPGEQYTIESQWRNECSTLWKTGSRLLDSSETVSTNTLATSKDTVSGETQTFSTTITAPQTIGNYQMKLYLVDAYTGENTKETKTISVTINTVSSAQKPTIVTCPVTTSMGDTLIIKGTNFSPGQISTYTNRGSVVIDDVVHEGKWIEKWTNDEIRVKVQSSVGEGYRKVTVQLQNGQTTQNQCETYIESANPFLKQVEGITVNAESKPGGIITLKGENFGNTMGVVYIEVNGKPYRNDAYTQNILTWKENIIELTVPETIPMMDQKSITSTITIKRSDGKLSNAKPLILISPEDCTLKSIGENTPVYMHPYASTNGEKGLVTLLSSSQILTPIEWGEDPKTQTQWLHIMNGNNQGWIEMDQTNITTCQAQKQKLATLAKVPLSTSWAKVLRGEVEYVSIGKQLSLVKYKGSFPPIYTPGGLVYEGDRVFVIDVEGDWAKVMTNDGKVGWIDTTYLNIDPSPYIGLLLFPLAGDDETKILATQEYGWSEYALAGLYDGGKHQGIDLVPLQTDKKMIDPVTQQETKGCDAPVFSARDGEISLLCREETPDEEEPSLCKDNGNLVVIDHTNSGTIGLSTSYAHLNSISPSITLKQRVDERTLVGYTGNTGNVLGDKRVCHLDFGVWQKTQDQLQTQPQDNSQTLSQSPSNNSISTPLSLGESKNPYRYLKSEGRYMTMAEKGELGIGYTVYPECITLFSNGVNQEICKGDIAKVLSTNMNFYEKSQNYQNNKTYFKENETFKILNFGTMPDGTIDVTIGEATSTGSGISGINTSWTLNTDLLNEIGSINGEEIGNTWGIACDETQFKDTPWTHALQWGVERGAIDGPNIRKQCQFRPNEGVTRSEFSKIFSEGMHITPYTNTSIKPYYDDVGQTKTPSNEWYYPYAYGLSIAGIVNAPTTKASYFQPTKKLNLAEISKMLLKNIEKDFEGYVDCYDAYLREEDKGEWYSGYIGLLVKSGVLAEWSYPKADEEISRKEMIELMYDTVQTTQTIRENAKGCKKKKFIIGGGKEFGSVIIRRYQLKEGTSEEYGEPVSDVYKEEKNGYFLWKQDFENGSIYYDERGISYKRVRNPWDPNENESLLTDEDESEGLIYIIKTPIYGDYCFDVALVDSSWFGSPELEDRVETYKTLGYNPLAALSGDYWNSDRDGADGYNLKKGILESSGLYRNTRTSLKISKDNKDFYISKGGNNTDNFSVLGGGPEIIQCDDNRNCSEKWEDVKCYADMGATQEIPCYKENGEYSDFKATRWNGEPFQIDSVEEFNNRFGMSVIGFTADNQVILASAPGHRDPSNRRYLGTKPDRMLKAVLNEQTTQMIRLDGGPESGIYSPSWEVKNNALFGIVHNENPSAFMVFKGNNCSY